MRSLPFAWDCTQPRATGITRRELLRRLGLGLACLSGPGTLWPACGSDGAAAGAPDAADTDVGSVGDASDAPRGDLDEPEVTRERVLSFDNWPFYIDPPAASGGLFETSTLQDFQSETGIRVDYSEGINDNDSWLAQVQASLEAGVPTGYDLAVLTDWMVARLIRRGYLEALDVGGVPNQSNLLEAFRTPWFDPERGFSVPWQAGLTGIAYDVERTGRELSSVDDLFDPAFAGRVMVLNSMRDTLSLILLGMDIDPAQATVADAQAASARLASAISSGQLTGSFGGAYLAGLASGDVWVAVAWSGDILQAQLERPSLRFLVPEEGALLWSDNLVIPRASAAKAEAQELMAYYLRPDVAARLTSYVGYLSPVAGTQAALRELAESSGIDELADLADNPLVFPDATTLARTVGFKVLDDEEEAAFNSAFEAAISGS